MASFAFDSYLADVLAGSIASGDTYKVMLTTSAYTPNQTTDLKRSAVTNEVTGTGYTAGGQTIVPTFTKDTTNHKQVIVFPSVAWPTSTITARRAVYYKSRGGVSSADELVAVDDFGADIITTAGTFTLAATTINLGTPV